MRMGKYIEFEAGQKYAKKGADTSDTPDSFQDCGYLLEDDDLVIDIDHLPQDSIRKLLEVFDIKTQTVWTDRGAHLYFKKPEGMRRVKKDGICRLAIDIEQKCKTNSPKGITIKRNGVLRTIDNPGVREDLPAIFTIKGNFENLIGLSQGDGRNNKLFKHKMDLAGCEDWPRILKFINDHVFAEPLPEKEFKELSRQQDMSKEAKAEESEVADTVLEQRHCCKWGGKIWFWDYRTKTYIADEEDFKSVVYEYCPGKKTTFVDEVVKQVDYRCKKYPKDYIFKIKLKNGYLKDGKFFPFDLDEFTPFAIDLEYKSNARAVPVVDEYIRQLTTKTVEHPENMSEEEHKKAKEEQQAYKNVLLETLAFPLIVDPEMTRKLSRFFIFRGDGANGKGTLLQIIKKIYGPDNCAFLSIENMADEKYFTSLIGKLVNLGDDIEDKPITKKQFKLIKNITTVDDIEARFLYRQSQHVQIQAKLMFTSNSDIRTFDKGYALKRRMYWMPMFNKVEKPDPKFISRITTKDALEYWLRLLVEAYKRLCEQGWTPSEICTNYNDEYHQHNDISELFINAVGIDNLIGHTLKEVKDMFNDWNTEDERKLSSKNFKQNVWEKYQVGFGINRTSANKIERILMYQNETKQNLKPNFK